METRQITLTYDELDNIVVALVLTIGNIDAEALPSIYKSMNETQEKMLNIEIEWKEEMIKGAN